MRKEPNVPLLDESRERMAKVVKFFARQWRLRSGTLLLHNWPNALRYSVLSLKPAAAVQQGSSAGHLKVVLNDHMYLMRIGYLLRGIFGLEPDLVVVTFL
jgi:hypothetical protein